MKKLVLLLNLALVLIASNAWAIPDYIQPTEYNGSQQVKSSAGYVCSASLNYTGVTAGNNINLKDSIGSGGSTRLTLVAATTSGNQITNYKSCAYFSTGIYYQDNGHAGTMTTDIQSY